jgi:hypothetical protein
VIAELSRPQVRSAVAGAGRLVVTRSRARLPRLPHRAAAAKAGRQVNLAAAILALSVLADSGVEHYRGSFRNRVMFVPLGVAALTLMASLAGVADRRPKRHPGRDAVYGTAAAAGLTGLGFHAYNILKRPGRLSWHNLFYGAPAGAPIALLLSGLLGRTGEKVRDGAPRYLGLPMERLLGLVSAVGLFGTVGEAGLLHFRGAFQNPAMVLPVSAPPVAAALLGHASIVEDAATGKFARAWLRLTAALGFLGVGFHTYGVVRQMGGWRNWRQNLLNGPPLPAPPSFTGLAIAGLAALALLEALADD